MSLLEVVSKVGKIQNNEERIYLFLSDFRNLDSLIPPEVQGWKSNENSCQFLVKSQMIGLEIVLREPFKMIKYQATDDSVMPFLFWVQLVKVSAYDTRIRLTVHAEVNAMMKIVLKKQLKKALDQLVDQLELIPYP
jgi:carbon monoxide dehydrogenase subunit G